jgi:hypothetical protein
MSTPPDSLQPPHREGVDAAPKHSPSRIAWLAGAVVVAAAAISLSVREQPPRPAASVPPRKHASNPTPAFPLQVSADGHYLVDKNGAPFRLQTEAWVMSTRVTPPQFDAYLADRKARGFNGFLTMAIMVEGGTYGWSRTNARGEEPFTTIDHFDTPNDSYFDFIELIIDKAAAQGFVVQLFYTYVGYNGGNEGWWSVINEPQNTQAVCFEWGRYLGKRFKDKANLIWMVGGDYTMPKGEGLTRVHKILEGIRAAGAYQLAGSEWGAPDSLVTDQPGFSYGTDPHTSDIQLDSYYGLGPALKGLTYDTAGRSWLRKGPTLPGFLEEPMQAYAKYAPTNSSRASIRRYQHWSITSGGIAGSVWGIWAISDWHRDWQAWLGDPSCADQENAFDLYQSLPWWLMRPSGSAPGRAGGRLIVDGEGEGDAKITASITSTGSHLIAYVPPTGTKPTTFAVDLRSLSGDARARWWNPTNGSYVNISSGDHAFSNTSAAQSFTTPGDNGTATNDWMLVLDARAAGQAAANVSPTNTQGQGKNTVQGAQ